MGRRLELERLRASWGGVQMHRDRRIVLVAGEPGIGKTRLVHHFASAALAEGATVLEGRCSEEPLAPFEPFVEALAQAATPDALEPGDTRDDGARHRLFDAVDAALADLCESAPLLLMIDDFHWADRGTLLLTSFLLRSSRRGPMLVLGTYRDTELGRHTPLTAALAELGRGGALDRLELRGLPADDVATLTRAVLGTDESAARVHARTDGNAFFVEEVLRELAESGPDAVPESVRHAVGVRRSRMGDAANEVITAAAILGLEHDARALQATAGLEPADTETALDEILHARLLRPASTRQRFEFAHALVREAVLDECNVLRRARLHRRAADALTALGEERHLEEVAMHLFEAASIADARRAAEMLLRAGHRALDRLAYEDAAERFDRALEALSLVGAEDASGPVLLARGDAPAARRRARRGTRGVHRGARACATTGRQRAARECRARLSRAGHRDRRPRHPDDREARGSACPDRGPATSLPPPGAPRSGALLRPRPHALRGTERRCGRNGPRRGDASALASALGARHVALWRPDRVEERLTIADDMIAAARAAGDRHAELRRPAGDRNAELFAGMVRFCAQLERDAFDEIDLEFLEDKIANSPAGTAYRGSHAWILAGLGETERAREELRATMELAHAFDANWLSFQVELAEASVLLAEATFAAVLYERLAPYAGRPVTAGRAVCSFGAVDRSLGGLAALLGRERDATRHLKDAVRINDALGCIVWRGHAERAIARIARDGPLIG